MQAIKEKVSEQKTAGRESHPASYADVLTGVCHALGMRVELLRTSAWEVKSLLLPSDQFRFLGNCLPTPSLSHHFALSEK